jgi:putative ABC transport system ATP-binding protein
MLKLVALTKSVPGGRTLFHDLDLTLEAGHVIAIMGESGVGKSTLLNLVAGLDTADSGAVLFEGADLGTLDDDARTALRRDHLGFVFQAFLVLPHLTVVQNVALPLVLKRTPGEVALQAALRSLEDVGLEGRGDDFPRQLSGGELQRVAIARALIHRPKLLLADEPTGNLDPETAARILEVFSRQVRQQGASVILVTHSEVAAAIAERTYRLTPGGLVCL